jgi:AcrR family transcriptional regulator
MAEIETREHVDTRESLLDAAESLFSEHGIQAASLRAITQQAGANLAAVHYHFGSKEGLVRAVFQRRLKPLNEERLRLLEAAGLEDPENPENPENTPEDAVERVLEAFLGPVLRAARETPDRSRGFSRLMGRAFSEPSEEVRNMLIEELSETIRRFLDAFARLLPHLSEQELVWRFHFAGGAMGHTVSCGNLLEKYSHGLCHAANGEEALDHLVSFLAAGMRAPAVAGRGSRAALDPKEN